MTSLEILKKERDCAMLKCDVRCEQCVLHNLDDYIAALDDAIALLEISTSNKRTTSELILQMLVKKHPNRSIAFYAKESGYSFTTVRRFIKKHNVPHKRSELKMKHEDEILDMLNAGMSRKEIASRLGITRQALSDTLQRIKKRGRLVDDKD